MTYATPTRAQPDPDGTGPEGPTIPTAVAGPPSPDRLPEGRFTVVARLLWAGVGRMAVEEARHLPARLLVFREASRTLHYDLSGVGYRYLRPRGSSGRLTPWLRRATMAYNAGRGEDATVDLDLIVRGSAQIEGPAIFHDQFSGLAGFARRFRRGEEYVLYLHETALGPREGVMTSRSFVADRAIRWFDATVLRGARLVLTNSVVNQSLLRRYGFPSTVLYPGCDPDPTLGRHREPIVLATSIWDPSRHMETYVELAALTRARVVLAGTWGREEARRAFQARYGDRIEVTGPIPEAELRALFRRASVYVRFGFGERGPGQGGIQAYAQGVPVIANRGLPMAELIADGSDGFVVDTVAEAAERVNRLLDDPAMLARFSERAFEKGRSLSWAAHAARLREILHRHAVV